MQPVAVFAVRGSDWQPASLARDSDSEKIDPQNQHYGWYGKWGKVNLSVNDFATVLQETVAKLDFVNVSEAKGLCPKYRILRSA